MIGYDATFWVADRLVVLLRSDAGMWRWSAARWEASLFAAAFVILSSLVTEPGACANLLIAMTGRRERQLFY